MPVTTSTSTLRTGQELIKSALRLVGVLASGEEPTAAEANDGLEILNDMIEEWNNERLMVYSITKNGGSNDENTFPLVANQQLYTLGPGGNFNVARPLKIERASIEYLANPASRLELPIPIYGAQQWQGIPTKQTTSTFPRYVYIEYTFPLINLRYWPVPNEVHNAILYYWTPLQSFADLTTQFSFPPGYFKAMRYALAVDLAAEYGRSIPSEIVMQAIQAKARIKATNERTPILSLDPALTGRGGHYDWRSDTYR